MDSMQNKVVFGKTFLSRTSFGKPFPCNQSKPKTMEPFKQINIFFAKILLLISTHTCLLLPLLLLYTFIRNILIKFQTQSCWEFSLKAIHCSIRRCKITLNLVTMLESIFWSFSFKLKGAHILSAAGKICERRLLLSLGNHFSEGTILQPENWKCTIKTCLIKPPKRIILMCT